jgi:hypothetical protein
MKRQSKNISLLIVLIYMLAGCEKDRVTTMNVCGNVINMCTDSVLSGVKVYLNNQEATTDPNGNFTFQNIEIHSKYSYLLKTESNGTLGGSYGAVFNGDRIYLNEYDQNYFIR